MELSTGKVDFPVNFDNGDIGHIYFNPNDRNIQKKISEFEANIEKKIKEIDIEKARQKFENTADIKINSIDDIFNMSRDDMESLRNKMEAITYLDEEYNEAIKSELNNIFDSDISSVAFKYCQPLDKVFTGEVDENGQRKTELYVMQFMKWFAENIQKYVNEINAANSRIEKHIGKYK